MYSAAVLEHAAHPRNFGELPDATNTVEATNPVCGDELRLAVRVEDGRITAARFHSRGCKAAIASASLLTELMTGKSVEEIREITAEQISQALGGLPAATRHGSQLAEDALDALLDQL
jgi:nitrogen fixation NifU-like protein